jgi:hypothetical protein
LGNADKVRVVTSALVIDEGISALAETVKVQQKKHRSIHKKESLEKKEKIEKIESVEGAEGVEEIGKLKKVEKMEKLAAEEKKCLVITEHLHRFLHHLMGDMAHRI